MVEVPVTEKQLYLLNKENGKTYAELGLMFGITRNAVAGRIDRYKKSLKRHGVESAPDLFNVEYGQPLELFGDWIVASCVHVPSTDYDFVQLISMIAEKQLKKGSRNLLLAGDLFNMDVFTTYAKLSSQPTWKQEKRAAQHLFRQWSRVFDRIVFTMGNHDRRIQKWTNNAMDGEELIEVVAGGIKGGVEHSNFGWCTIQSGDQLWRSTHPKNYSINQLVVPDQLAQKYQCNIISGHEHHSATGQDRYKNYRIMTIGTLADPIKFPYANLDDSKSAGMAQSFGMIRNGFGHLFDKHTTDWSMWL